MLQTLLSAIYNDDRPKVERLLRDETSLATRKTTAPKLYQDKLLHWLYAGDTALHLAAAGHRWQIARRLLKAGADVNAAANHRRGTPLHYAADGYVNNPHWNARDQVKTIEALLSAGADIQARDKNGATPLHRAVRTRCARAVECLLNAGADADVPNISGTTPRQLALINTGHGGTGTVISLEAKQQIIELLEDRAVSTP
ncbi:MAG: ankyrin repeat domain-containing protein [Burkholderiales bacterium]|nr:ankyrin repeat domain-containing protein [Phycisphaerae bacterium]